MINNNSSSNSNNNKNNSNVDSKVWIPWGREEISSLRYPVRPS